MKTYHNAGSAGREYAQISISVTDPVDKLLGLEMRAGGLYSDIVLNLEQAIDLRDALTQFIGKSKAKPFHPMIEGDKF